MLPDGYVILPDDSKALAIYELLIEYELVENEERRFVRCVNPNDLDYINLRTEEKRCRGWILVDDFEDGIGRCNSCPRKLNLHEKKDREMALIVRLRRTKIISIVMERIRRHVDKMEPAFSDASWKLFSKERTGFLSILEYLPLQLAYSYISSDEKHILGVALSNQMYDQFKTRYPLWPVISLHDLILNQNHIGDTLNSFLSDDIGMQDIERCKTRFMEYVSRLNSTGTEFEEFCLNLEKEIYADKNRIRQFLARLDANRLLAIRPLHLGGPGKPDIIRLPLFQFFRDYISHCKSIEAKQYLQTRLRIQDISKALYHAARYGQNKVVLYTADDRISPSIWDDVARVKDADGAFVYFVLDADFIAFLIASLDIESKLLP